MRRTLGGIAARLRNRGAEADLREYLLDEAKDFRRYMCDTFLGDQAWTEYAWRECSKPVDQLACGEPHRLHRWELPDDHPARVDGAISDDLILTADDRLMLEC